MNKKLVGLVLAVGMFSVATPAFAATLNVSTDTTKAPYMSAVIKSVDRLVTLQNANGSWDWVVTGATGPTSNTYYNITGVTAQGLLNAYTLTGKASYLQAAENAGGYLLTAGTSTNDAATARQNAFNIVFLNNLAHTTGVTAYSNQATAIFTAVFSGSNYWTTNNGNNCTADGCTADQLVAAYENYRGAPITSPDGIVAWDIEPFVEAAVSAGTTTLAQNLEQDIVAYATSSAYVNTVADYSLGLSSALRAAVAVGDSTNQAILLTTLRGAQNSDGSFGTVSDGQVQATAYGLLALNAAGDNVNATRAANYLATNFGYSGINGWKETDNKEYSESDSEAARALATQLPANTFYTVQDAVDAANSGDMVSIAAGTYTESGQIVISKNLSIVGADKTTTIIKPAQDTTAAYKDDPSAWILVNSGVTFNLSKVTLDGTGKKITNAILSHGLGTIDGNIITNIGYNPSSDYNGAGLALYGATTTVSNNSFSNIGREGIFTAFFASTTISGNTYTGKGAGNWLDYGIEIGRNSTASISGNTISGNTGVATVDQSTSAGIIVATYYDVSGTHSGATITNNTITGNTEGISVGYDSSDVSVVVAHNNNLSGNITDGATSTAPTVDATNNWWGDATGPMNITTNPSASGSGVSDHVTYSPWFSNAEMTKLGFTTIDNDDSEHTKSATNEDAVATTTPTGIGDVHVDMPVGLTIKGPSGWDGVIGLPTATTTTVAPVADSGNDASTVGSIEVGFGDTVLTFNKAVRLIFAGQAGHSIGYSHGAGTFHQITAVCTGNNDEPTQTENLAAGADCKISNDGSGNLVVWTKHFSTFTTYTQTATPAPASGGGGPVGLIGTTNGGGGGGAAVIPTAPASTPAQGSTSNTGGEVLGAQAFNFAKNLTVGSRGTDVTELHKVLIAAGFLKIPAPTGWFGPMTLAAVKQYQKAHGIPTTGFVGVLTRGQLNKGN